MKSFQFPLDKALELRRKQLEAEEALYKREMAALGAIDRRKAEIEAAGIRAEIQVRGWSPIAAGDLCALVTATNSFVTAPIAGEFGIPHLVATEPERSAGRFTGRVAGVPCFREGKVARVEGWLAGLGRPLREFHSSTFYSDSHNDLALLERVTRPVAVDPDASLAAEAARRGWPVISLR